MRTKVKTTLSTMFPQWPLASTENASIEMFSERTERTPVIDPYYSFPQRQSQEAISILEKDERNNLWLSGYSGSGKSSLIRQLAAVMNVNFFEINGHEFLTPANLFGRWVVRGGETKFQDGVVVKWLEEGGWLLINEYSTQDPAVVNALKSCLEYPRTLTLTDDNYRVVQGHPDCRLISSDNTQGRGDDSGAFVNTQIQSLADMRRFNGFLVLDYLEREQEIAQLVRRFPDPELAPVIDQAVTVANQTREGFKKRTLGRVLSTAEVINWVENYKIFITAHHSARISFLNSYEPEAATAVRELINTAFGREDSETLVNADAAKRSADKTGV